MEAAAHLEGLATGQEDHRQEPRLRVDEPASLLSVAEGSQLPCRIVEISLTGCRLLLGEPSAFGAPARVEAAFKLRGVAFGLAGVSNWSDANGQVGIRFTDVTSRRMDELIEVLCEIAAEHAKNAVRRAAQRQAEESQRAAGDRQAVDSAAAAIARSTGPGDSVSRQAAQQEISADPQVAVQTTASCGTEKLPAAAIPPAASACDASPAERSQTRAAARERRTETRLQIETSAVILLVNVGSRLRGRIVNLSLGGCRIRTEERFPVGIYTRVETEFRLDGLPFRLGGVVQAIQERYCVGIRFLDMSERKRHQVEQLIGELACLRAEDHACATSRDSDRDSSA